MDKIKAHEVSWDQVLKAARGDPYFYNVVQMVEYGRVNREQGLIMLALALKTSLDECMQARMEQLLTSVGPMNFPASGPSEEDKRTAHGLVRQFKLKDAQLSALREELGRANETVKKLAGFLEADHLRVASEFGECDTNCEVCVEIKKAVEEGGR